MSNNNTYYIVYFSYRLHGTIVNRACKFKVVGRLFSPTLPQVMQCQSANLSYRLSALLTLETLFFHYLQ